MRRSVFLLLLLAAVLVLNLSACAEEQAPTETALAETTALETEAIVTEPAESLLLTDTEPGKVYVSFVPTEVGYWRHVELPNQENAVAVFEATVAAVYSDEWWIKGDKTVGLDVEYNGEIWSFVDSGELVCATGRVQAQDASGLYDLCIAAAREAGRKDPVKPEQLTGIVSATLRFQETELTLTDPEALATLEQTLTCGIFSLGGTKCPFGARLDLETESGELLTVAMSTDSCGVWMSEGNYYDYGSDNNTVFDLFGVEPEPDWR